MDWPSKKWEMDYTHATQQVLITFGDERRRWSATALRATDKANRAMRWRDGLSLLNIVGSLLNLAASLLLGMYAWNHFLVPLTGWRAITNPLTLIILRVAVLLVSGKMPTRRQLDMMEVEGHREKEYLWFDAWYRRWEVVYTTTLVLVLLGLVLYAFSS